MFILKENAIKAYKAMHYDYTCMTNFKYEIGKTYSMPGSRTYMCNRGFHCCRNIADCYLYYDASELTRICEVEVWGIVLENKHQVFRSATKLCANNIKIIRELSLDEIYKKLKPYNFGQHNFGSYNTGCCNIGSCNTGNYNVGRYNTGSYNIGNYNSGNDNRGSKNIGCHNIGQGNIGSFNVGHDNQGSFNISSSNIGHFNLKHHDCFCCFDKPCDNTWILFPGFLSSIESISGVYEVYKKEPTKERDLSIYAYIDTEPKTTQELFHSSFEYYKKVDREHVFSDCKYLIDLPCFDYAIFERITGITKDEIEEVINE